MHRYLRAIGFSTIKSRAMLEDIYHSTLSEPNRKVATTISNETTLIQFDKNFGDSIGLSLVGEFDKEGNLSIEHYFPYLRPKHFFHPTDLSVEKYLDKEGYAGIFDDTSMNIIFYVQNIVDYSKLIWFNRKKYITEVMLSALSTEGSILIPLSKTESDIMFEKRRHARFTHLLEDAKSGDREAIDKLFTKDMDLRMSLESRIQTEDLFTIVDTSLVPYGVNCEHYEMVGTIASVNVIANNVSGELIYDMDILCNELPIRVCINQYDLIGEPEVGRRFKGVIWLQGYLNI